MNKKGINVNMKKAIILALCVGMIAAVGGCGKTKTDTNTDTSNANTLAVENTVENTEETSSLADVLNSVRTESEAEVYKPVTSKDDAEYNKMVELLGIDMTNVDDFAIAMDTKDEKAYTLAIFKVPDEYVDVVTNKLNEYTVAKTSKIENADEKAIAEKAKVVEKYGYVVYTMCNSSDAVSTKIASILKDLSLNATNSKDVVADEPINSTIESSGPAGIDESRVKDGVEKTDAPINNAIVEDKSKAVETPAPTEEPVSSSSSSSDDGWR